MPSNLNNSVGEESGIALRAIVVEDEESVLNNIRNQLNDNDNFQVVGTAGTVLSGIECILKTPCDVIFLDIKLKGGLCTDLINGLRKGGISIPPVVIITGEITYTMSRKLINEYNDCVIYVLHKPFVDEWTEHRERVMAKINHYHQQNRMQATIAAASPVSRFYIKYGAKVLYLNIEDIVMVKVPDEKGTGKSKIVFEKSEKEIPLSLTQISEQLPSDFVRISRDYYINPQWISAVSPPDITMRTGETIHIGTAYRESVAMVLGL